MKLSLKWLQEFVDTSGISDRDFSHAMTMSGSIVESVSKLGGEISNIVAGRILSVTRHPDADKLQICAIEAGGEPITIVTGASNVAAGQLVPVALAGSTLPGGKRIEPTVMRSVESSGMLCSMSELGLDTHDLPGAATDGILILDDVIPVGTEIQTLFGLDDTVAELEITPNRPDCLSVRGIAREVSATFGRPLTLATPSVKGGGGEVSERLSVEIAEPTLCPRYTARVVENVKIEPSPSWMRERLRAGGVRPINNIVDITNYVMLEYSQPMHAFDYSCLEGGKIIVRRARTGETLSTLDDKPRELTPDMLVIADSVKATAVAGVMGGAESEITDKTTTIVFESANFNGASVRTTALALNMRTDSSSRFEKGLDPENTVPAIDRACELVELLGCGTVRDGRVDVGAAEHAPTLLALENERINALLGTEIPVEFMRGALQSLGFTITESGGVEVPSYRMDVTETADLAEEVARIYGYDNLPVTLPSGGSQVGGYTPRQRAENLIGTLARAAGYSEILTYSFISPAFADKLRLAELSPLRNCMKIINPLGEDTSVMRTTALGSLIEAAGRNASSRVASVRLYELARVYLPSEDEPLPAEPYRLMLAAYGGCDFFAIKGDVEAILGGMRVQNTEYVADTNDPTWHPGRCAKVYTGDALLGTVGQIHPEVAAAYGVTAPLYAAELDFEALLAVREGDPLYVPLPRYPSVTRDIAVVCAKTIPAGGIVATIKHAAGALLADASIFDVYEGGQLAADKKSVAVALAFRAEDRTLTDDDVEACMAEILTALDREHGAVLR